MVVYNDQVTGSVLLKFSRGVLREVLFSLSGLQADAVNLTVIKDVAEHIVDSVAAAFVLDRASTSSTLVALPANNVVKDVHVDGIEICHIGRRHVFHLVGPFWRSVAVRISWYLDPFCRHSFVAVAIAVMLGSGDCRVATLRCRIIRGRPRIQSSSIRQERLLVGGYR